MIRTIGTVACLLVLLGVRESGGTPEAARWRREMLLGVNSDTHVLLVTEWSQPGRHDQFTESVSMEVREHASGSLVQSSRLFAAKANTDDGRTWDRTGDGTALEAFDLVSALQDLNIRPVAGSSDCSVEIQDGALGLVHRGKFAAFLSVHELGQRFPTTGTTSNVVSCYHIENSDMDPAVHYSFILVRFGDFGPDSSGLEQVVVVPRRTIRQAWESLD